MKIVLTASMYAEGNVNARWRKWQQLALCLGCCCIWTFGYADPIDTTQENQIASRAMLEFLTEFAALEDAEFDLLTAFADQDAELDTTANEQLGAEQPGVNPAKKTEASNE